MGLMRATPFGREAVSVLLDIARNAGGNRPPATREDSAPAGAPPLPPFDRVIDGLNRLPRPMLAFGTLAMFGFAMIDPLRFAERMAGLQQVPEPLWWLLGGVVGFHFGAREAHHFRSRIVPAIPDRQAPPAHPPAHPAADPADVPETGRDMPTG